MQSNGLLAEDLVDQAVGLGLCRRHEVVAFGVALDFVDRLAGVPRVQRVDSVPRFEDFEGVDLDVAGLPLHSRQRLMDHHAGVRENVALAFRTGVDRCIGWAAIANNLVAIGRHRAEHPSS